MKTAFASKLAPTGFCVELKYMINTVQPVGASLLAMAPSQTPKTRGEGACSRWPAQQAPSILSGKPHRLVLRLLRSRAGASSLATGIGLRSTLHQLAGKWIGLNSSVRLKGLWWIEDRHREQARSHMDLCWLRCLQQPQPPVGASLLAMAPSQTPKTRGEGACSRWPAQQAPSILSGKPHRLVLRLLRSRAGASSLATGIGLRTLFISLREMDRLEFKRQVERPVVD
ncbi:hypothetical protein [Pseudomonas sp. R1-15]|uniref:hypothetical protein n=1 Tax=Pseudomonas sp. R1-15 TaxID=2817399 RepID=UPI003DA8CC5F